MESFRSHIQQDPPPSPREDGSGVTLQENAGYASELFYAHTQQSVKYQRSGAQTLGRIQWSVHTQAQREDPMT